MYDTLASHCNPQLGIPIKLNAELTDTPVIVLLASECHGLAWDSFLCVDMYNALFWIFDETGDGTPIF